MKKTIATLGIIVFTIAAHAQNTITSYFYNGQVEATYFVADNFAERISYYEDGLVKEYASFLNNKPDGLWKYYNQFGMLISSGTYNSGQKSGVWKTWNAEKNKMIEVTYLDNFLVKSNVWATVEE